MRWRKPTFLNAQSLGVLSLPVMLNLFQHLTLVLQGIKTLKQVQGDETVMLESRWE